MLSSQSSQSLSPSPAFSSLCVLCVSAFSSLASRRHPEQREGSAFRLRMPSSAADHHPRMTKPFRIRTCEKPVPNPFGIRTSKTQDLKPFRIRSYKKTGGGGCLCSFIPSCKAPLPPRTSTHLFPSFSTASKHPTHSNIRNSNPLMRLLHCPLYTRGTPTFAPSDLCKGPRSAIGHVLSPATHYPLFTTHYSPLTIHNSLLTAPQKQRPSATVIQPNGQVCPGGA
jgi:hypothetical protein